MTIEPSALDRVADPLRVGASLVIPVTELGWRFSRSSGPGGQGVNTADSRVELTWNPAASRAFAALPEQLQTRFWTQIGHALVNGELTVAASEFRSQLRNREAARERLAKLITKALTAPPPTRRPTKPGRRAVERRLAGKRPAARPRPAGRGRPPTERGSRRREALGR
ncbi:aminoacyl-tRNA hydrolase [Nakamurella silvestris]|nr:aminoacyl-tRNA hydrolase [Nakamurella silvestris]